MLRHTRRRNGAGRSIENLAQKRPGRLALRISKQILRRIFGGPNADRSGKIRPVTPVQPSSLGRADPSLKIDPIARQRVGEYEIQSRHHDVDFNVIGRPLAAADCRSGGGDEIEEAED